MSSNNLTREEAARRAALFSNVSYRIALDVTRGEERFGCETIATFDCVEPGAETFLDFVCDRVTAIELNGAAVDPGAADGNRVRLPALTGTNTVRIQSEPVYEHTGVGLHRFVDPVDGATYLHTQFESFDAHKVFPCFDQPDVKATFVFEVRAPREFEVASNMTGKTSNDGDARVWTFEKTPVMSTYITAIVAGPFHIVRDRHGDIDLGLWSRRSLAQYLDPDEVFEITKQGFDFYTSTFGVPYPFGKYDQLFVPEFNAGAMENAGCVTFNESYIFRSKVTESRRERRAATILHEMAHMWFGDLVTMKWWDDLWLNESFAEYVALVAQIRATRFRNGFVTFSDSEKTWAYRQDQLPTTHPIAADVPDVESVAVNFDGISYAKGASVLRQLVAWVGEDQFVEGLRSYFRTYAYGNADLNGFLEALETASGRDLKAWSKEWLQTAGVNTLRAETSVTDGAYGSFEIVQEAPAERPIHRSHRIAIGLYDAGKEGVIRRRRIEIDVTGDRTPVPDLIGEAPPGLLVINDDDLTFAKIRFDERSLATISSRLREIGDPLTRALCWTMSWDMVRDAELPAHEWSRIVYNNIEGETDIGVLRSLLDKVRSAILVFGTPANRESGLNELASLSLEALRRQEPGSDMQLVWGQAFAAAARSKEHVGIARGLLDGSASFEGLALDTDLRWHIVTALAGIGAFGEAEIAAELERDPTDQGERFAATARAAQPRPEAKEAAWRQIVEQEDLSFATMRALMAGFQRAEQEDLLRPYGQRYFEQVVPMYEARELPVAMDFADDMYPQMLIDQDTLRATDDYLAGTDVPPPVRRFVIEGRDTIARALRARAKDAG